MAGPTSLRIPVGECGREALAPVLCPDRASSIRFAARAAGNATEWNSDRPLPAACLTSTSNLKSLEVIHEILKSGVTTVSSHDRLHLTVP